MTMKTHQAKIQFSRRAMVSFALATAVIRSVAGQSTTNQRPPLMDRQKKSRLRSAPARRR
jgi:hypothetical protein